MAKDASGLQVRLKDGTVVGYAEFGDPLGRPLVFFHGWPGSRLQARIVDAPARRCGLRVLAPDRPGIGLSTAAHCPRVADWMDTLAAWIDAQNLARFYVLGVSGGGPYALACALRMPERIAGAGVCCGAPLPREIGNGADLFWIYRLLRFIDRTSPRFTGGLMAGVRLYLQWLPPAWSLLPFAGLVPGPDRRSFRRRSNLLTIAVSTREAYRRGTDGVIADARRLLQPWGFDPADLSIPVQFWHGHRDRNVPHRLIAPLVRGIPGARARHYPAEGHYSLPLERCTEILEELTAAGAVPT